MIRLNGKKIILVLLAAVLCLTACAPAFASVGDRILMRNSSTDGYMDEHVQSVVRAGDGICIVVRAQEGKKFLLYKDLKGEPETYIMQDNREPQISQDENGSDISVYENTMPCLPIRPKRLCLGFRAPDHLIDILGHVNRR